MKYAAQTSDQEPIELTANGWGDYELLDSGNRKKLERFGQVLLVRFEPQAIWKPALPLAVWDQAHAEFSLEKSQTAGRWVIQRPIPADWQVMYRDIHFKLTISASRHIGIFPEQQPNWDWVAEKCASAGQPPVILNLFAYTGGMTAFACRSGAAVTHVDASRRAVQQASQNLALSGLGASRVRWIVDDAFQFVQREVRRGNLYDGIIMDPPAFGHGPQRQVWKLERSLPDLLSACANLLKDEAALFLLTAYNVDMPVATIRHMVAWHIPGLADNLQCGTLFQQERSAGRKVHQALFARWSRY